MSKRKTRTTAPPNPSELQAQMLADLLPFLPPEEETALRAALSAELPPVIRLNPLKQDLDRFQTALEARYGWKLNPVAFSQQGFSVEGAQQPVSMTLEHRLGEYYIQDAASMLPPELFDLSGLEEPLLLDMAASPGGKTTHLAERLDDRGLILANDSSRDRLSALKIVLQNCGTTNCAVSNFHGEFFGGWFPETFDAVLLDAPCSMQNLRASENHPLRPISAREQTALARRQYRLLESAVQALKTGGQVVYSTCTLSPIEDEQVLDMLLSAYPDAVEVEDVSSRFLAPGLAAVGAKILHPQAARGLRLWPHRFHTSGFFAALLRKTGRTAVKTAAPPSRELSNAGFTILTPGESQTLWNALESQFGLEQSTLLAGRDNGLLAFGQRVFLVPQRYLHDFAMLPVSYLGLEIGQWQAGRLHLRHEFVSRFQRAFARAGLTMKDEKANRWLAGEDIEDTGSYPDWPLPLYDRTGRFLGLARKADGKLRNLLPARIKSR